VNEYAHERHDGEEARQQCRPARRGSYLAATDRATSCTGSSRKRRPSPTICRVLVVDDHEGLRNATAEFLENEGHAPVEASNGQEALEARERFRRPVPELYWLTSASFHAGSSLVVSRRRRVRASFGLATTTRAMKRALETTARWTSVQTIWATRRRDDGPALGNLTVAYRHKSSAKDDHETALHVTPTFEHACPSGFPTQRFVTQLQLVTPQISKQLSVAIRVHVVCGGDDSSHIISFQ
jgi:CheY-like chemotaxis protein